MSMVRIRALPCWQGEPLAEPLSGGLSNEIWKVSDAAGAHVARFGQDFPFHHVSREREAMASRAAAKAGFGPEVEYVAPGIMVCRFIEARTWAEADMRNHPGRIASLLREFHTRMPAHMRGTAPFFWVFHVIRDYAATLRACNSRFIAELPRLEALATEMEAAQVPLPIVFGHHDLLPGNFMDDGQRLWLIDFEYAGFGTAMFDLAGAASNAGMSADQADRLLTAYFGAPPDADLRRAFDAMQCASLVREAMWAMVSEHYLAAPGADYQAHASDYLGRLQAATEIYRALYGKPSQ
ncbi:MAG: phosphotransferase family protein [Rhodobacteraceae bacterium]|nr:phosphotransferase family protein [Paracoccaceae bacterium]